MLIDVVYQLLKERNNCCKTINSLWVYMSFKENMYICNVKK